MVKTLWEIVQIVDFVSNQIDNFKIGFTFGSKTFQKRLETWKIARNDFSNCAHEKVVERFLFPKTKLYRISWQHHYP